MLAALTSVALLAIVAQSVISVATEVHLYADGAHFLRALLEARRPTGYMHVRHYAALVVQGPVVIALRAGVTDVAVLSRVFGAALHLPVIVSLLTCLWIAGPRREYLLFPVASVAAVTANSSFFIISESHVLAALFWPLVLLLVVRNEWSAGTFALAALLAIPTLRSYESMLFFGPFLTGLGAWRAWRAAGARRVGFAILGVYFLAGTVLAAYWVANPQSPDNYSRFVDSLRFYRDRAGHWHVMGLLSLAGIVLVSAALLAPPLTSRSGRRALAVLAALGAAFATACVAAAVTPLLWPTSVAPRLHYMARVLNAYLPLVLAVLLLVVRRYWPPAYAWRYAFTVVTVLAVAQATWHGLAAQHWAAYLDTFRHELATRRVFVPYRASVLSRRTVAGRPVAVMNWGWTMPTMSVLLAPNGAVQAIVDNPRRARWQPFDPTDPDALPDLARYGIHFDEYRATLGRR